METTIEPKFKIGQKVFYTDYTDYCYDWDGENEPYKGKSDSIADNIVLYGTITGVELYLEELKYSITVEEYDGLEENNMAVEYRRDQGETWDLDIKEENIFSLSDIKLAKKQAQKNRKKRIKYELESEKESHAAQTLSNALFLYDFLLREYNEFDIKYSKEQLDAFYKLISSPRMDLSAYDTQADIKENYKNYAPDEWSERNIIDKDKQYVELLRTSLKVEGYTEL